VSLTIKEKMVRTLLILLTLLCIPIGTFSQEGLKKEKKITIVPVPYVSYNRTYDFMFGAVPMLMYKVNKNDSISPASLSGAIGIYTTNKSWFTAVFSKFYLKEDRWRVLVGAGLGNMNSQFLQSAPVNQFINYQTGATFFKLEVQRKIGEGLYLGGTYLYTEYNNEFEFETTTQEKVSLNGLGGVFVWDKRDDVYYPRTGHKMVFNYMSYPGFMGNDVVSNQINMQYNVYLPRRNNKDVWALRCYAGFGIGDVAFNNLLVVGGTDLRGYSQGEYRGKQLVAAQTEYRYNFKEKMGLVAFAGLGSIFESDIKANNGKILPSVGVGYRYLAFPKNKMNVGLDLAVGEGDWGVYFRIGESF
jgi:hypothetical protein